MVTARTRASTSRYPGSGFCELPRWRTCWVRLSRALSFPLLDHRQRVHHRPGSAPNLHRQRHEEKLVDPVAGDLFQDTRSPAGRCRFRSRASCGPAAGWPEFPGPEPVAPRTSLCPFRWQPLLAPEATRRPTGRGLLSCGRPSCRRPARRPDNRSESGPRPTARTSTPSQLAMASISSASTGEPAGRASIPRNPAASSSTPRVKKGGSFSASPTEGPLSVRWSAVLPPPYQWLSSPTVI